MVEELVCVLFFDVDLVGCIGVGVGDDDYEFCYVWMKMVVDKKYVESVFWDCIY